MPFLRRFAGPALVVALAVAWLYPILSVPRVPSVDGPAYASIGVPLRVLLLEPGSPLGRSLELNWRPTPFWVAPALVALLTAAVEPPVADKVLFALELLLVPLALALLRRAAHGEAGTVALLGFPLGAHLLFRAGFHGFSLGVPVALLALAVWWRHRRRDELGWAAGLGLLLALAWLTHLFAWAFAVAAIAGSALVLRDSPRRARLGTLAALAICAPLLALESTPRGSGIASGPAPWSWERLRMLVPGDTLAGLGFEERWGARATVALLLVLAIGSLRARRDPDGPDRPDRPERQERPERETPPVLPLALGALAAAAALLALPNGIGPGGVLAPRFALVALLLLAGAVREPRGRLARAGLVAAVVALAAHQVRIAPPIYAARAAATEEFLAGLTPVRPGERLVTQRAPTTRSARLTLAEGDVTRHAAAWRAAEAGAVDLGTHFLYHRSAPVRLRAEHRPDARWRRQQAASAGSSLALGEAAGWVELVYLWGFEAAEVERRTAGTRFVPRTLTARGALLELARPAAAPP